MSGARRDIVPSGGDFFVSYMGNTAPTLYALTPRECGGLQDFETGAGHESRCATNHIGRVLLATHCQEYATLA
jgi:hypothetical protein